MRAIVVAAGLVALIAASSPVTVQAEVAMPPPSKPRNCKTTVPFDQWFAEFKRDAMADGIKSQTIAANIGGMTPDQGVISRDRRQSFFSQSFLDFYAKLATNNRQQNGRAYLKRYADLFDRAEQEFGVPGGVITGFWALESDFGAGMGNLPVMRSLLTLAWDCRRGEMFREELKAALKIIERGDLRADEMIGSWAGELGQTQFLPGHYYNYSVDYDNDGRRDMITDIPDIIGSTANFIKALGWKRGQPWLEEVRLTKNLPWKEADLAIYHPRSQWAQWGVTGLSGALPADALKASLLLPMGRNGPAFLAYENFRVYLSWNQSLTYATTAAHLAGRMAGAPNLDRSRAASIPVLGYEDLKQLQAILTRRGHDVGEVDGKLGAGTRAAVKAVQIELGFPPDSYPTPELLAALRSAG